MSDKSYLAFQRACELASGKSFQYLQETPLCEIFKAAGEYGGIRVEDRPYVLTSRQINEMLDESLRQVA